MGFYHPNADLHNNKKHNTGLFVLMGLAVLPARLKGELACLGQALASGGDLSEDPELEKHIPWVEELRTRHTFTAENVEGILRQEVGVVFSKVLEHAGVFPCSRQGREAFLRFVESVK